MRFAFAVAFMASQLRDPVIGLSERWDVLERALREIEPSLKVHVLRLVQENMVLGAKISEQASTIQKLQVEKLRQAENLQHLRVEQSQLSGAIQLLTSEKSQLSGSIQELTSENLQLSSNIDVLRRRVNGFEAIRMEMLAQAAAVRGMGQSPLRPT
jgi:predicted RNase H-like nuclease (RuvC/YqgF family)